MIRLAFSMAGLLLCANTMATPVCPIERAHYAYSEGPGSADFKVLSQVDGFASPVALHLNLSGTRDLWFLFDQGSARYVSLISVTDPTVPGWSPPDPDGGHRPIRDQKFFAWNDDLKIQEAMPQPGSPAPTYILVPDLPETLQYGVSERMAIGAGIFKLNRCDQASPGTSARHA